MNTVIIRHKKERKSKCSLEPLVNDPDLSFYTFPGNCPAAENLTNHVRLSVDGPLLSAEDTDKGILLLDGTWKLVEPMNKRYAQIQARSLPPLTTAYPRISKLTPDPQGGLASVEALAAACHLLGRPYRHLLNDYHWADQFIELNSSFFAE